MYSIVMLTAMSAGADVTPPPMVAPAPHSVTTVASGCCGAVPVGCYGSCHGSSCHGGIFGLRSGGILGLRHSCHGSSCHGYSCFGSCHGCSGAFSYGSTWGPAVGTSPYTLHGYNTPGTPVYGPGYPVLLGGNLTNSHAVYGNTFHPNRPPVMTIPVAPIPKATSDTPMGANLKFTVPANTKLFVDGKPAPGTGTERAFYTPALAVGQKFFYDVKAELMVDGKLVVEEKRVIVEAGAKLTESFPKLVAALNGATNVAGK